MRKLKTRFALPPSLNRHSALLPQTLGSCRHDRPSLGKLEIHRSPRSAMGRFKTPARREQNMLPINDDTIVRAEIPLVRNLIYDVGAHEGEDTEFYLEKGFSVVAIEANPGLCQKLATKFARQISSGKLKLVSTAIAEYDGTIDFYINEKLSVWGTTYPAWAERNERLGAPSSIVKVPARRFQDVLAENGIPYYLKIDIEGADLLCLKALCDFSEKPRFISIESEKVVWNRLVHEFSLLESLGYRQFNIVNQKRVHRQVPPRPHREGLHCDHKFAPGSSGLFGKELPGRWLTTKQAINKYRFIFIG